jgi:hypothetical protein
MVYAQQDSGILNINAEGLAQIVQNDLTRARENAIKDALEKAILEATARLMSGKSGDEKFQALKSEIVGASDKYINDYRITAEVIKPQEYQINVNVNVASSSLKNDLLLMGLLQPSAGANGLQIILTIKKLKKYSDFSQLKLLLQNNTKTVKTIYLLHFEWQQVSFAIDLSGDLQSFIKELKATGKYLPGEIQPTGQHIEMICLDKGDVQ